MQKVGRATARTLLLLEEYVMQAPFLLLGVIKVNYDQRLLARKHYQGHRRFRHFVFPGMFVPSLYVVENLYSSTASTRSLVRTCNYFRVISYKVSMLYCISFGSVFPRRSFSKEVRNFSFQQQQTINIIPVYNNQTTAMTLLQCRGIADE